MKNSLHIGSPFGIKVMIHWTFLILIIWIVVADVKQGNTPLQILESVIFMITIFGCVILHELGHALAARRFGINTRGITLLPIGGVASLDKIPEEPKRELFVAIAGPLVNIVIAGLIFLFMKISGYLPAELYIGLLNSDHFLPALLLVNILLALFNLIPAFPMDGGRLLRAGLAFRFNRVKATNIAARIGQLFAVFFAIWGLFNNPFLVIIAVFIFLAAQAELRDVQSKSILADKMIKDVMMKNFTPLRPDFQLKKVIEILLNGQEEEFIVVDGGKPIGLLTKNNIIKGLSEHGQEVLAEKIMNNDFMSVGPEYLIKDVYEKMQHSDYKILPVEQGGQLIGVVNLDNINEYLLIHAALKARRWFGTFF